MLCIGESLYDNIEGGSSKIPFIVFGCKGTFENCMKVPKDEPFYGVSDATFCLFKEGWTIYAIGLRSLRRVDGVMTATFRPCVFVWAKTERGECYLEGYTALRTFIKTKYGRDLVFKTMCIDQNAANIKVIRRFDDGLCNMLVLSFNFILILIKFCIISECIILFCWPHIKRLAGDRKGFKFESKAQEAVAIEHLDLLHMCRSESMFLALAELVLAHWTNEGHTVAANWLKNTLLVPGLYNWFLTSAIDKGNACNSNVVESKFKNFKIDNFGLGKGVLLTLGQFANKGIHTLLEDSVTKSCNGPVTLKPTGIPQRDLFIKAYDLTEKGTDSKQRSQSLPNLLCIRCNVLHNNSIDFFFT